MLIVFVLFVCFTQRTVCVSPVISRSFFDDSINVTHVQLKIFSVVELYHHWSNTATQWSIWTDCKTALKEQLMFSAIRTKIFECFRLRHKKDYSYFRLD